MKKTSSPQILQNILAKKISLFLVLLTFFIVAALHIDLAGGAPGSGGLGTRLSASFQSYSILSIIALPVVYAALRHSLCTYVNLSRSKAQVFCIVFPAFLFSLFIVFGWSFNETDSWDLVFGDKLQMLKSLVVFLNYFIIFFLCITEIFSFFQHYSVISFKKNDSKSLWGKYQRCLLSRPFRTSLATLIIAYIPYIIVSYPAIFMGDTIRSFMQGYNMKDYWAIMLNLVNENVRLNSGQPVIHTLFLHAFMLLHNLFSWNIAIFLYCMTQFLFIVFLMSLLIRELAKIRVRSEILTGILIFYIICPRINNYMFLVTKDIIYAAFLILYHIALYRIVKAVERTRGTYIMWGISLLGILLLRNEGVYLIVLSSLGILLFCKNSRKQTIVFLLCAVIIGGLYNKVLLPAFDITPASRRESLTIPFQQTARYLREAGDEVTEEEKEAISNVLKDYDTIVDSYDPYLSDYVKDNFNESATSEDMKAYFKVWWEMFKKHPEIYIQATINNLFLYVYPDGRQTNVYTYSGSAKHMADVNERCSDLKTDFSYPDSKLLSTLRYEYQNLREGLFRLAPFAVINTAATYVWIFILWVFYCFYNKKKMALGYSMLLFTQLLICIAAPSNGAYFRYLYPIAVCLPAVILFGSSLADIPKEKANEKSKTN